MVFIVCSDVVVYERILLVTALMTAAPEQRFGGSVIFSRTVHGNIVCLILQRILTMAPDPETWVPGLGDAHHGFPYLSGAGRLVLKDIIMMGAGFICLSDSSRRLLAKRNTV
jgi:uncharacterized membrane protein YkgB